MAGGGEGTLANIFLGNEETAALGLRSVLRAVCHQRLEALFHKRSDVHGEGGTHIRVEAGVEDLEGTVRRKGLPGGVGGRHLDLGKTADKAGLVAEGRGRVVVGMAALPVGQDHDPRSEATQNGGDLEAVFEGVLDVPVGQVEGFAGDDFQDSSGFCGLGLALLGGAAGARLAACQVEDTGAPATRLHGQQGTTAGLFDVVAVGSDGEYVDLIFRRHTRS